MAGESPDKSEQRKSSGETAPGERDPRLAVFRASPGATAPGVDQPTAVFKLPASERSGGPGADQDAGADSRSGTGAGLEPDMGAGSKPRTEPRMEPGTESGSVENDVRLRSAVAAWVAGADGDAEAGEQTESQAEDPEADAPDAVDASGGDGAAEDAADSVERDAGGREDAPADDADEDVVDASGDGVAAEDAADSAERDAGGREDAPGSVRDAVAGEQAESQAEDPEADAPDAVDASGGDGAADSVEPDADGREDAPADDADADVVDASGDDSEAGPADASTGETGADIEDAPGDEAAAASSGGGPAVTAPDDEAKATAGSAESAGVKDDAPSAKGKDDAPSAKDTADAADAPADGTPAPSADKPRDRTAGSAESAPAKSEAAKPDASPDAKAKAAPTKSGSAEAKPSKPAVDQPTAAFKALRRPAVDQPTTALKVPPKPRPGASAEWSSTFVPLRTEAASTAAPAKPEAAPTPPASLTEAERTRQQPMPPLPPLDLLAELTNTPPPPQTPVRTVVRRIKIWTPLVVLLLIIFAVAQAFRPLPEAELALSAEPTFTFKGGQLALPWADEGQGAVEVEGVGSMGTYGAQKPAPIASIAKTMTAYVILKNHPIKGAEVGPKITVDQQAEDESKLGDESTAQISTGQQFTELQMLQLLMIPSGNNAARLLARWDAKSEAEFVKKMNDAAKELGMTNSTYTDPSGLKATTVSSPQDQLKLAKAVMQYDVFRKIVNTTFTTVPGIDGQIRNNNDRALLKEGVGGIKTGSSTPAGGNLLWSANVVVDGQVRRIVGITMGVQKAAILNDKLELAITHSIRVIEAAQAGVTSATVIKKGDVVGYVDDGLGGRTPVVATKEFKAVGWAGLKIEIELADGGRTIPHTAKAGTVVGQLSVGSGTGRVSAPVALQQDLAEPGLGAKLTRIG